MCLELVLGFEGEAAVGTSVLVDMFLGDDASLVAVLLLAARTLAALLRLLARGAQLVVHPRPVQPVAALHQTGQLLQTLSVYLVNFTCMFLQCFPVSKWLLQENYSFIVFQSTGRSSKVVTVK